MLKEYFTDCRFRISTLYRKCFGHPAVYDAVPSPDPRKGRALLVYSVVPFMKKHSNRNINSVHQNQWQVVELARLLAEMNYAVDVIADRNMRFVPKYEYDLLLGLGIGCTRMAGLLPDRTRKLFIMTGSDPVYNNTQEQLRLDALKARRGVSLKPRRMAVMKSSDLQLYDAVACIGNETTRSTLMIDDIPVYAYNNHFPMGLEVPHRDYRTARRNFVYLASAGQVHKGLDLLLEVFADNPDLHLHVCGPFHRERDFVRCYEKELYHTANIHPEGWIDVTSARFLNLSGRSAAAIMPSCAEGQSGAVVTCMGAGLIPIVSNRSGIDTDGFGITLESCSHRSISEAVCRIADTEPAELEKLGQATRRIAESEYSQAAFSKTWSNILRAALERKQ